MRGGAADLEGDEGDAPLAGLRGVQLEALDGAARLVVRLQHLLRHQLRCEPDGSGPAEGRRRGSRRRAPFLLPWVLHRSRGG